MKEMMIKFPAMHNVLQTMSTCEQCLLGGRCDAAYSQRPPGDFQQWDLGL